MSLYLSIKIESGNAAFGTQEEAQAEIVRILRGLVRAVENQGPDLRHILYDVNGNRCGQANSEFLPDEEDRDA